MSQDQPEGRTPPIDFVFRYRPDSPRPFFAPRDAEEATGRLREGNAAIVRFAEACQAGGYPAGQGPSVVELARQEVHEPYGADGLPIQMPFAAVLGCADARVPAETLFGQEFNDLFTVRVAGNVPSPECIGSLLYALGAFAEERPDLPRNLRLILTLGHRGCGAVQATLRASEGGVFDAPGSDDPVGAILHRIHVPAGEVGARAFDARFGHGSARDPRNLAAMVDLVVHLNAAWSARTAADWAHRTAPNLSANVGFAWGVFDPHDLRVRTRPPGKARSTASEFAPPPADMEALRALAEEIVAAMDAPAALA